jgi:hypothetical protein
MSEALRMLRNRTDVPPQLLAISQLGALRWYAACLNANHHKAKARQIKSEILQLQSEQHSAGSSSTVSAAALQPDRWCLKSRIRPRPSGYPETIPECTNNYAIGNFACNSAAYV